MKLSELLTTALQMTLPLRCPDSDVVALSQDSRSVSAGSLFVAVRGFHSDGHQFIPQALAQGAVAVIAEETEAAAATGAVPVICVPDSRAALARLATVFYGQPSKRLNPASLSMGRNWARPSESRMTRVRSNQSTSSR